jgi:hydroxypyruvate isomerase
MELIEGEVQHANVFVHLDSYHMNIEESRWERHTQALHHMMQYMFWAETGPQHKPASE